MAVVQDDNLDGQFVGYHGAQFLNVHLQRTVARHRNDLLVGKGELRAYGRGKAIAHRAETAAGKQGARLGEGVELGHPHLVLPHFSSDDGVAVGKLIQGFNNFLRLDIVVFLVAERFARFPFSHGFKPRGMFAGPVFAFKLGVTYLGHAFKGQAAVAHHRNLHFHVFTDGGGVYVDVNDAGLGRKPGQLASDAVVKARADTHEHVGIVDGKVGRVGAVHAHHAEPQGISGRKCPKPHKRTGYGNLQFAGKARKRVGRIGHDDAAASQNDRAFGLGELFHRAPQLIEVGLVGGVVAAHVHIFRPDKFGLGLHDVLGQVDEHGPGAARARQIKGLSYGKGQLVDVLYQKVVLGAGAGDAHDVHFLKSVIANQLRGHLPRNYY